MIDVFFTLKKTDGIPTKWWFDGDYPLVNIQIAIENGHRNSGYFPIKHGGPFQFAMLNYQRVY